jgi:hypothetical protein
VPEAFRIPVAAKADRKPVAIGINCHPESGGLDFSRSSHFLKRPIASPSGSPRATRTMTVRGLLSGMAPSNGGVCAVSSTMLLALRQRLRMLFRPAGRCDRRR